MKIRVDERLREETDRLAFRFACDHCAHAEEASGSLACSLGYPASPRLDAMQQDGFLELCKTFELG